MSNNIKREKKDWKSLYNIYIQKDFKNWDDYFHTKMRLKKKFIKLVVKYSKNGKPIIECGCGTGKTSVYLATLGIDTYAVDIEKSMVEQTSKLSHKINKGNFVKASLNDINNLPFKKKFFSVAHSSGVMEHFSNKQIVKIINEQLRIADFCIFSVPSKYFDKKMLGNERFLRKKEWKKIILQSDATIINETGYHYKKFKYRMLDVIKKPEMIFKPIALYTFVLKRRDNL